MYNEITPIIAPLQSQAQDDPIDPGFTYPDMNVPATPPSDDTVIDPGFSVTPNNPGFPGNRPPVITVIPQPIRPCLFCSSNQWLPSAVRFLNAAVGYNAFTIYVGSLLVYTGLEAAEITRYTRVNPGFQTVTIQAANGYVFLQKSVYFGDGMSTVAIVNSGRTIDVTTISDTTCSTNAVSACVRACNLASYSGSVNVMIGSIIYSPVEFKQVTSFSNVRSGNYPLRVARSLRPGTTLVNTDVNLNANRIYTVYVMNWNTSPDAVQTLLVEDRRN